MNTERWVMRIAGAMILLGLLLAHLVNVNWLWLPAFVGANLLQSSFTGFCPLAILLKRFGVQPGNAFS